MDNFLNSKKFIMLMVLLLICISIFGCAKPTQKIQIEPEKKVPTELETIGKLEAIGTVLGCMFDPAPCEEKKKQAETEELEKHGNTK